MDDRMMKLGGQSRRAELMQKVNTTKISTSFGQMNLGNGEGYSEEEAKVAKYGEKGQGDYLVEKQRSRKK